MEAEFSAGVCLISFGAVLGVASPVQLLIMILFEMVFYKVPFLYFYFSDLIFKA